MSNIISGTRFTVVTTNLFLIPDNNHMIHLATIQRGLKEFIVMLDRRTQKVYIEEVVMNNISSNDDTWASFKFIEDDNLALDLAKFCEEQKIIDMVKVSNYLVDQGRIGWLTP